MMKKIFLLAAFAVSTLGVAQDISFGAKAGVNLANVSVKSNGNDVDSDMLIGYHVGGFAEFKLSEMISIQPELLFSAQGSKSESTIELPTSKTVSESTNNLNYLTIPVMGKFYVADNFSLEVGPQLGILLGSKQKTEGTSTITLPGVPEKTTNVSSEFDAKGLTETIDFGINVGLGYKLESGLNFAARYNFGFMDIAKDDVYYDPVTNSVKDWPSGTPTIEQVAKNGVIQISVGYFFK